MKKSVFTRIAGVILGPDTEPVQIDGLPGATVSVVDDDGKWVAVQFSLRRASKEVQDRYVVGHGVAERLTMLASARCAQQSRTPVEPLLGSVTWQIAVPDGDLPPLIDAVCLWLGGNPEKMDALIEEWSKEILTG